MMTRTHAYSGAAAWLTLATVIQLNPLFAAAGTVLAWHAARVPDIDNTDSTPAHQLQKIFPDLPQWLEKTAGHRGITHWGISAIGTGAVFAGLFSAVHPALSWLGVAIGVGWITHIVGDCLTIAGAPLLAPFVDHQIRPPRGFRVRTGGYLEMTIISRLVAIWMLLMIPVFVYTLF